MSDIETSMPTRAEILSVIGGLEALRPAPIASLPAAAPSPPPASLDAAQARHDQDAAALRDMTAERDAWQDGAARLQAELWRELEAQRIHGDAMRAEIEVLCRDRDGMGTELLQHREQIAHLSAAMSSLLELANSRPAATPTAPPSRVAAAVAESSSEGYALPAGVEARPSTQPPPPPVDPNAAPMVIPSLAPDLAPPVKRKPIRAVQAVAPRVQTKPEPAADVVVEDLPPVVEFTAPEPDAGVTAILPTSRREKKRRLRIG